MTEFLARVFNDFLLELDDDWTDIYSTLLYLPWILKPLFGFIADWLYPFYYRTKGHMFIIGVLNVIFAFVSISISNKVMDSSMTPLAYFICMLLIYYCLAAVDSICLKTSSFRKHDLHRVKT